jgi:NADH-quinone oxidoreductase subunit E
MSDETMTVFSPRLAARFDALAAKYPLKRSALIPMLLYAQDEVGYLSDVVINEVAQRIGLTELEVRNVASYYSMLRFKPAGRFNVQVCTNISCMLRGGYELYERFQEELGVGHKGVTADGVYRGLLLGAGHPGQLRLPRRAHPGTRARHSGRLSRKSRSGREGQPCLGWFRIPMK